MVKAGALVAVVAVPLAAICAWIVRRRFGRLCPRWRPVPFVWPGLGILAFFLGHQLLGFVVSAADRVGLFQVIYPNGLPPMPPGTTPDEAEKIAFGVKAYWVGLGWVPLLLAVAVVVRQWVFNAPPLWPAELLRGPRAVFLGVLVGVSFGTVTVAIHTGLTFLFEALHWSVTEHPLSKMGPNGDGYNGLLLVLSACAAAPLIEEFLFRGLLVPWAGGRWYRPWVLLFVAAGLATTAGGWTTAAVTFVAALGVGQYVIQRYGKRVWRRLPRRTVLSIWSSSALFAAAHSAVWPTPIPLFVLGLGLGYLTARTRSWAAAAVAHSLFNLVATVFVFLRG